MDTFQLQQKRRYMEAAEGAAFRRQAPAAPMAPQARKEAKAKAISRVLRQEHHLQEAHHAKMENMLRAHDLRQSRQVAKFSVDRQQKSVRV
jgi:hypothetical protein